MQLECEGFIRGSKHLETDENTRALRPSAFVSRCLEPLIKPEARVFGMASQSIFCCVAVRYYWIVLFTKLVCQLFQVGLAVYFFRSHFRMCLWEEMDTSKANSCFEF